MRDVDPLWSSLQARDYMGRHQPGSLVRLGRQRLGWRQAELGSRIGCSASTVSRLETGPAGDLRLLQRAAHEVGVPDVVLGAALGLSGPGTTTVAASRPEEDPMRRRTLLTATAVAGPAALLAGVDDALAATPAPTTAAGPLDARLAAARSLYDTGAHRRLLADLPGLIADAHAAVTTRAPMDQARLSAVYSLATAVLSKLGSYQRARLTADRARTWAEVSGSPLASAAAARELAIVLRHQDQGDAAQRLIAAAAADVETTGLRTDAAASAYAQLLCTTAYTAAQSGNRGEAQAMIQDAVAAARRLPSQPPAGRLFPITPAAVDAYAVSVHWALGDSGTALAIGSRLPPQQLATAERRGRFHTDMARAWWQWGRPAQTAAALLDAARVSPSEVRDRPAIRRIVTDLRRCHPHTVGVRELVATAGV
jgi:transcriptional regulator with XRE-family HTH domain